MAVKYDFYETPVPGSGEEKKKLHVRVVPGGTTDSNKLAELIHSRSTLSKGDIRAVITSLEEVVVELLKSGGRVHLDGIGYFEMTLSCPAVSSAKEIRAESVRFKSVAFRPEKRLKKAFADTVFVRSESKKHSAKLSEAEVDSLLAGYFASKAYITRSEFEELCGLTRTTANRRLAEWVKAGKLQRRGVYRSPVYEPMPGFYGVRQE